ncbi:MAG TPA: endonuclease, partial [Thermoanaerobaculia bacterium]
LDERHHNRAWPATFPATSPLLALDRIYARGVRVIDVRTHQSAAARRGSDHLPVVASIEVEG